MPRRLAGAIARAPLDHRTRKGRAYTEHFRSLLQHYGSGLLIGLLRDQARVAALAYVQALESTRELDRVQRAREAGRGRRPSLALVRMSAKRNGLDWNAHATALRHLEELARGNGHGQDLAARLSRVAPKDRP